MLLFLETTYPVNSNSQGEKNNTQCRMGMFLVLFQKKNHNKLVTMCYKFQEGVC